jgi:ABC-2 type transport system permease protein
VTPEAPAAVGELQDIRGPSAIGGGWRRFRDLLWVMSVTDFKITYFGTILGYVWSLIRPLLLFGVLLFVFKRIFRFGDEIANYPVLLLFNIMLFTFFAETTGVAVASVVNQEGIVRKTQFPRLVIPLSNVLTGVFNLLLSLIAVFIFILAYGVDPTWTWLLLPVGLIPLVVITAAVCTILSALFVRFRDVSIIWSVLATVLFYGTPVLYPLSLVPSQFREIVGLNPLTPILGQLRKWIIDPTAPGAVAAVGWPAFAGSVVIFFAICGFAVWVFNYQAPRIAEEL